MAGGIVYVLINEAMPGYVILLQDPKMSVEGAYMVELRSTIRCPTCGHGSTETMPTDACQYLYVCKKCGQQMKPKKGDCCVFCSYGDVACPPIQEERGGCCGGPVPVSE